MTAVSEAHWELCRWLRCKYDFENIEIDGSVLSYHKKDHYREISVSSKDETDMKQIHRSINKQISDYTKVRIFVEGIYDHPSKGFSINISIWPK